ncbi:interleukin-5 receptor subunit alpha-like isoform X3 [Mobula hypostoma]|uniref:interleukin-5 receptor subunit alpha-like isoform X3 n=1 Tax=Mobula hypostoma TaxID=723540 RepID=UPI002FC27798
MLRYFTWFVLLNSELDSDGAGSGKRGMGWSLLRIKPKNVPSQDWKITALRLSVSGHQGWGIPLVKENPPLNIQLSNEGLGLYTVSWDGNITFEKDVYYQLQYKYLNSSDSKIETYFLQEYQRTMDLELQRGLSTHVKLSYAADSVDEISSNWTNRTFVLPRDSFASVDNLTCVFYGNTYMNCTWDVFDDVSEDAQYTLSYRKEQDTNDIYNCTNYRVDGTRNTGCIGHRYDLDLACQITMCISDLTNKTKLPYCRIFGPYKFQKLGSPINVKINKSTDEVTWNLAEDNLKLICYAFQLKITDLNSRQYKVENTAVTKYVISRDKTKRYSVQVRVTVNNDCLASTIWSDWSKPLIIAPDASDMSVLAIASVFAVILVVLILLLIFICIRIHLSENQPSMASYLLACCDCRLSLPVRLTY